jgi:CubicO group peptidase (beta-lactamase class C family)
MARPNAWCGIAAAAVAAAVPLCAQKPGKKAKTPPAASGTVNGERGALLDRYVSDPQLVKEGLSGVVLVAKGEELLLEKGYGWLDAERKVPMPANAQVDWCSVSKQFTAACVLRLVLAKKLRLDDPLTRFFPKAPADKAKVTLRHLLNHTSGIDPGKDWSKVDPWSRESVAAKVLSAGFASPPGEKWEYSNAAYFLVAAIVEKVTGKPFERVMRDEVFGPAGMSDSGLIGDPQVDLARVPREDRGLGDQYAYGPRLSWGYRGAGGVVATVRDLWKWDRALRGEKVLPAALRKEYYQPALEGYALGWEVRNENGRTRYQHSGHTGKLVTYYLRILEDEIVVAIACNGEPSVHVAVLASNLAAIARTGKAPPSWKPAK